MRLEEAEEKLAELVAENSSVDDRKDVSENSARDAVIAEIKTLQNLIDRLREQENLVTVPGGWAIDDTLKVNYTKIVAYGKDKAVPPEPMTIRLYKNVNITEINLDDPVIPVDINSDMGKALFNKAHKSVRFNTTVGYCIIEVERVLA
jgi:hypothetical protein